MTIKEDLDNQMIKFNNHPLLNINTNETMNHVIESMFNLNHSRIKVLQFFQNSIQQIGTKGAVQIESTFSSYTKLLQSLMTDSNEIIGTFTTKPSDIRSQLERQNTTIKDYIETLKTNKEKITRICVLEKNEIQELSVPDPERKKKNSHRRYKSLKNSGTHKSDDIIWFKNNVSSKVVRWDETTNFVTAMRRFNESVLDCVMPNGSLYMIDFAIFDKDILLRWNADENNTKKNLLEARGTIVMLIGDKVKSLHDELKTYLNLGNGYSSFDELCRKINLDI